MAGETETLAGRRWPWRLLATLLLGVVGLGAFILALSAYAIQHAPIAAGNPNGDILINGRTEGGDWDLFLIRPSGEVTNLTGDATGAHDFLPSWSMDGARINFVSTRSGSLGPVTMRPDGSDLQTLSLLTAGMTLFAEGQFDWDPVRSRERLAWSSLRDLNLEIYSLPVDAPFDFTQATRHTSHAARDWYPAFSPDGAYLAFSSDRNGNEDIFVLDLANNDLRQITDAPWDEIKPQWGADGEELLFITNRDGALESGDTGMMTVPAGGGAAQALGERVFTTASAPSPAGDQLLYASNREGGRWHLYVTDRDGGNTRRITPADMEAILGAWRP
jgi:hypothetical protein